jgi:hypothetical protein
MLANLGKLTVTASVLLHCASAGAVPFGSYDTRSMAMGGVGVALGEADVAPLYNPALLSVAKDEDKFSIILPSINARVSDPQNLLDSIDKFQTGNYVNNLQTSTTNLQTAITAVNTSTPATISADIATVGTQAGIVTTDLNALNTKLTTLSNKPISAEAGAATVVAIPRKKLGLAFYANGNVVSGGVFQFKDAALLTTLATNSQCLATAAAMPTTTPAEIAAATAAVQACTPPNFASSQLNSAVDFRGVMLGEAGFSFSREFYINRQSVAFGITPKIVKAQLYDGSIKVNSSLSSFNSSDYRAEYIYPNFDIGVAKYYRHGWRAGLVVKNILTQYLDYKQATTPGATPTPDGHILVLRPQVRAGVSRSNTWSTLAMDLDMTPNDPTGLENYTQYFALGGEVNAWNWAQLRAGYRVDLIDKTRNVSSAGIGFSPYGVHIDIAVAWNISEIGASAQLGFRY